MSTSLPPPDATEVRVWTLHTPEELRRLRAGLGEIIAGGDELADVPERMVLVASELATNAIRHGQPPTEVRLLRTDDQFVLDVIDHDPASPPEPTDVGDFASGGRGLHIAQRLSLDVGWYTTDMSKHVWASFPITQPSAAG
ncbi:anti-sigma regulatory factor (Ser/Thr protein kinase) [Catenuloplanes niger]|uniref:Anti-sigma regulatory factor (Ser/Thr protein kinase) n=1 Tax=Catenuloplanes niger TaxID=587534 RepID=A0AAE3ZK03_9ACTN|nr:anti-sigma regulatory factor (Ser/Thr protein kinase) [Catenuloplanes niger]